MCSLTRNSFLSSILNYHYTDGYKFHNFNPNYRVLIRKIFKRASGRSRRVFRTNRNNLNPEENNPVYEVSYSPVSYQDYRVIAVGDEFGYLSTVKIGYEGKLGIGNTCLEPPVFNRGATSTGTICNTEDSSASATIQPVLYTLNWNDSGDRIITGYGDGSIRIWDVTRTSEPVITNTVISCDKSLKRVAWCGDDSDRRFISCSRTNEIFIHDVRMRKKLVTRIDCAQLNSRLTDVCVVDESFVCASSSNTGNVLLFDMRRSYNLLRKVTPLETFELETPGIVTLGIDNRVNDGIIYALGSNGIVRSFNHRTGENLTSYNVPERVDYFTRLDVDKRTGVIVTGSCGDSAFGFDVNETSKLPVVDPFFKLKEGRKVDMNVELEDDNEQDKENEGMGGAAGVEMLRSCCAVGIAKSNSDSDVCVQIACGGDTSTVVVYD